MKKWLTSCLFAFAVLIANSQSYQGYRSGNYTGVNGVFFNPANVVDSRYSWDVNLVSVSAMLANNKASLRLKDAVKSFDGDSLLRQFTSNGQTQGIISTDVHGPSFMFNVGKKSAIAFTTRAVAMANITDVDGALINLVAGTATGSTNYPYNVNMPGKAGIAAQGYTEYGITYGQVLASSSKHFLKAGLTAKYLSGAGNLYMQLNDFKSTLNNDAAQDRRYFSNTTGTLELGFSGISFSDFKVQDVFKTKSSGLGADIGFVYELRTDASADQSEQRDINKYKLRLGLALQNIGSIKYEKDPSRSASYGVNISASQRLYTDVLENAEIDSIKSVLDSYSQYFTKTAAGSGSYKVALPALLALDADYHLHKNFYINAAFQIPLSGKNGKAWNTYQYLTATLTPRFEGKVLGVFVPLSYHQIAGLTAGLALRIGPLFVGSGSIINAVSGKTKQADVFAGLHIGGLFQKRYK